MVILLLHSVVGASLDFFCLFFFLFVSLVLFCCLFGIFCFYSYLIFSISLVCRLRSKGETFTNSLSWVLVCVLFLMHGSNDKELRKQINNNKKTHNIYTHQSRKGTFQSWLLLQHELRLNLCRHAAYDLFLYTPLLERNYPVSDTSQL